MKRILIFVVFIMCVGISVSAQTKAKPKTALKSKESVARTDIPVTEPASYRYVVSSSKRHVSVELGPRTTYLREGLSTEEVIQVLGKPVSVTKRTENGQVVIRYEFTRGAGRVLIAEFVNDALVSSRTEARAEVASSGLKPSR
jgi:hypothetical protein